MTLLFIFNGRAYGYIHGYIYIHTHTYVYMILCMLIIQDTLEVPIPAIHVHELFNGILICMSNRQ